MSLSLRDQLLQAGLISEKQAKQAGKHKGQQRREQARDPAAAAAAAEQQRLEQQKAAEAKAARDAELNRKQQDKIQQRERRAQVRQLIEQNLVPMTEGADYYNFVDGTKIRRIPVSDAVRERFGRGELAVVRSDGRYFIVTVAVAERIREREPHAVVHIGKQDSGAGAEDDPYKDYVVPDDLMW
jgi:uncharacterized protein YaiL (DUF2058 family)